MHKVAYIVLSSVLALTLVAFAVPALAAGMPHLVRTESVGSRPDRLVITVENKTGASISTLIDMELYNNDSNTKVAQDFIDNVTIGDGSTRQFAFVIPGDLPAGTYRFAVGFFNPGWQGLQAWHNATALIVLAGPSGPAYTVTQNNGQPEVTVRNQGGSSATVLVDLELYDNNNQKVTQKFFDNETISAGGSKVYSLGPLMLNPGSSPYRMAVGIFNPGWQGLVKWFNQVATFSATAGS